MTRLLLLTWFILSLCLNLNPVAARAGIPEGGELSSFPPAYFLGDKGEPHALGGAKGHAELLEMFNSSISPFVPTAQYPDIHTPWYDSEAPYWSARRVLVCAAGVILLVVALMLFWRYKSLRKIAQSLAADVERKTQDLHRNEEKYRKLYENAPLPYQSLNADGCFLDVNKAWLRTLGYVRDEVIGQRFADFLHPDSRPFFEDRFPKFKQRGYVEKVGFRIMHKKGHYLEISLDGRVALSEEGVFQRTYCVFHDITAWKQAEEKRRELELELRQKHKMEAVGLMAGGIAHNFNNSIAIILGNLELAQMKLDVDHKARPCLEKARIGANRSRDLVRKILSYSRQTEQEVSSVRFCKVIEESIGLLQSTLPSSVHLQKHISEEAENVHLHADAYQIEEILFNLCNNAVQAMEEKGTLNIAAQTAEITPEDIPANYTCEPGFYARLSVRDSGCGIPEQIREQIFDPFFTTKSAHEGTGMGLATVQGAVVQHGGFITVASCVGEGSTFQVYFPIVDEVPTYEPMAHAGNQLPGGTGHILYVDDEEMLAELAEEMLTPAGYQVTVMNDSSETLKFFRENAQHIDLLITDQTMPGLTGLELIRQMKKIKPEIPVILCTGHSSRVNARNAHQQGVEAYLEKPLGQERLLRTVRQVLDKTKCPGQ